ncbi:MAG: hypothetical protein LBJ00_05080 [Planctomycetaceae bacterium]|nr:hypothetical protein [Planctomycetaceae bacterium]
MELITESQQREAIVQGRSLPPYRLRYNSQKVSTAKAKKDIFKKPPCDLVAFVVKNFHTSRIRFY